MMYLDENAICEKYQATYIENKLYNETACKIN